MRYALVCSVIAVLVFAGASLGQSEADVERDWKWIVPLQTRKSEIEKRFGGSITEDKNHAFQTYPSASGKITVVYNPHRKFLEVCSCVVEGGIVLKAFISTNRFPLSRLKYDLTTFKKDETYAPREIWYYSAETGVLIVTEIVEMVDGTRLERVTSLEYRPKLVPGASVERRRVYDWFDSYGKIEWEEERYRLLNFTTILNASPNSKGYIAYNWRNQQERLEMARRARRSLSYLQRVEKRNSGRLILIDGGEAKEARTILHPLDKNSPPPDFRSGLD